MPPRALIYTGSAVQQGEPVWARWELPNSFIRSTIYFMSCSGRISEFLPYQSVVQSFGMLHIAARPWDSHKFDKGMYIESILHYNAVTTIKGTIGTDVVPCCDFPAAEQKSRGVYPVAFWHFVQPSGPLHPMICVSLLLCFCDLISFLIVCLQSMTCLFCSMSSLAEPPPPPASDHLLADSIPRSEAHCKWVKYNL